MNGERFVLAIGDSVGEVLSRDDVEVVELRPTFVIVSRPVSPGEKLARKEADVVVDPSDRPFFQLNADGGVVAAPGQAAGEAAIGVVLTNPDGSVVHELSVRIGWAPDHHVAEYRALIAGLRLARGHGVECIRVLLDSALVVNHVNGASRVKQNYLDLVAEARLLVREFDDIEITHVPRKWNVAAHRLADAALVGVRRAR